jgi:AcrR family transcriptional regulator
MSRPKRVSDAELLAAARAVFAAAGFGASTRTIAQRAGLSEAILYQRYRTKLDLFYAAMIPAPFDAERLLQRHPPDEPVGPAFEAITLEVLGYFRQVMPVLTQLVTHPSFSLEELAARHAEPPQHQLGGAVATYLEGQRRRGALGAAPRTIRLAALTLVATLHSLALFERMGLHGGAFPDPAVRGIARLLLAGLAPRQRGGRP